MLKNQINKKVIIAMSGGVDSSVAAYLLKEKGYSLIGITMKTWGFDDFPEKDTGCCSLETIYNARNVADSLGIDHYIVDFTDIFNEVVINNFINEYLRGRTPNPCVLCNKSIKWGALLEKADTLGADYIATGHYAILQHNENSKRYFISKSADKNKDQSYALWRLTQQALSRTIFPLGNYIKTEIREIASKLNLKSADTPDSQEICFVPDNNYKELLQKRIPDYNLNFSNGEIIYKGKVVGNHSGYPNYTIGQRRGLGLSIGKPVYVSCIDAEKNIIYVDDEAGLYKSNFTLKDVNFMKKDNLNNGLKLKIKIRYKDEGDDGFVTQTDNDTLHVKFERPRKAITPGQSAVLYDGEDIIAGGIIDKVFN